MPAAVEQKPERSKLSPTLPYHSPEPSSGFQHALGSGFMTTHTVPTSENNYPFISNTDIQPYDAWVLAGGRLFRAHAHILSAHSPYLRASINALGEARLLLPHVPAGGFSAVLTYMYTGRLSLAHAPVYEILITGHLLQMPSVIGLCQALLAAPTIAPSVQPPSIMPFLSEEPSTGSLTVDDGVLPPALNAWRNLARLVPASRVIAPMVQPTLIKPTPTRPLAVPLDKSIINGPETQVEAGRHFIKGERFIFCPIIKKGETSPTKDKEEKTHPPGSVIMDIAACDGPVFFERVINKAFRSNKSDADGDSDSDDDSDINVVDTTTAQPPHSPGRLMGEYFKTAIESQVQSQMTPVPISGGSTRTYHCIYCNSTFKSHYCYQKHMRRHINPITVEENRGTDTRDSSTTDQDYSSSEPETANTTSKANPAKRLHESSSTPAEKVVVLMQKKLSTGKVVELSSAKIVSTNAENTPSSKLRVLDLNVQYFPCKTCGSKFPSYYFVHKHRRLCHREEEDQLLESKGDQTPSSCDSSSFASMYSKKSDLVKLKDDTKGNASTINSETTQRMKDSERSQRNSITDDTAKKQE